MIVVGYTCPTLITLCTLIAEYAAPECASFRPRFGEESCFFAGKQYQSYFFTFYRLFKDKTLRYHLYKNIFHFPV